MSNAIIVKQGDTGRTWTATLKLGGTAIDLTGATVTLHIRQTAPVVAGASVVVREVDIVSAAAGAVSYQPIEADVDTAGTFALEWHIEFADGSRLVVPSDGTITLTIRESLDFSADPDAVTPVAGSRLYTRPTGSGAAVETSADIDELLQAEDYAEALELLGAEAALGNPGADGYVLSSTAAGARSWIAPSSGSSIARVPDTTYAQGREWFTDFASSSVDAVTFDNSGFTYTTDGGENAIHLTTAATAGTFLTKQHLSDCEVLMKFRLKEEGVYAITNVFPVIFSRYLDGNNNWRFAGVATDGNNHLTVGSNKATVYDSANSATGTFENTNNTSYRWMRARITGDIVRLKAWIHGASEPAWQIISRLRRPTGGSSPNTTADNIEIGAAGVSFQYGGFVQSLRITELVRSDRNLVISPAPVDIETGGNNDGLPLGWYKAGADGTNTRSIVSLADPSGDTRSVFKLIRTATGETDNNMFSQDLWRGGSAGVFAPGRKMPWPRVQVPKAVEVSLWSKGASVANVGGTLGTAIVIYYYDDQGTVLNFGQPDYYETLGALLHATAPSGTAGTGTWDWTLTKFRMAFANAERVTRMKIDVGFHDATATGTLWFTDVQMIPVP